MARYTVTMGIGGYMPDVCEDCENLADALSFALYLKRDWLDQNDWLDPQDKINRIKVYGNIRRDRVYLVDMPNYDYWQPRLIVIQRV